MIRRILIGLILAAFVIAPVIIAPPVEATVLTENAANRAHTTIAAGYGASYAIQPDGSLWAWGCNAFGEIGDGTTAIRLTPVRIMEDIDAVSSGGFHAMAIGTDGCLYAWGNNQYGQVGDGTTDERRDPIKIMNDVVQVSGGTWHTVAISADGGLYSWGTNEYGQLGNGTAFDQYTPMKIMDNVVQVSAGENFTMAVCTDGSLWGWGLNIVGQLGIKTNAETWEANSNPVKIMDDVAFVSAGRQHAMAIKTDGSLWAWGNNWAGQLGDGTTINRHTPVKIMDDVVTVSAAKGDFTTVIRTDGNLYAWGSNERGQLGNGTVAEWDDPGTPDPIKVFDDVIEVVAGGYHTIVIKTDGSLWGWGENNVGTLGDGTRTDRESPVKIMDSVMRPDGGLTAVSSPDLSPSFTTNAGKVISFYFILICAIAQLIMLPGLLLWNRFRRYVSPENKVADTIEQPPVCGTELLDAQYKSLRDDLLAGADMISDTEISDKILRLEATSSKIFRHVLEFPQKQPQIRRLTDHYIPTALKMIQSYSTMEKQGIEGDNISTARKTVIRTLDTLGSGSEQLLDQLFKSDVLDLSADLDVIESLLRQDGLMEKSPFRF